MDDYDGQMIFGDLVCQKLPDIRLTGEENPRKNLTLETCPNRESNPGLLRGKEACYHLVPGSLAANTTLCHKLCLLRSIYDIHRSCFMLALEHVESNVNANGLLYLPCLCERLHNTYTVIETKRCTLLAFGAVFELQ